MTDKWKEALRLVGQEEDRRKSAKESLAKITHEHVMGVQSTLDGPDFAGARRYFFFVVSEDINSGRIEIYFKKKGIFGFSPRASCVSAVEFKSLKANDEYDFRYPIISLHILSCFARDNLEPYLKVPSNPEVRLSWPEGARLANPWFYELLQAPIFKLIGNDWRLKVPDSESHLVANECSLNEYLLFFHRRLGEGKTINLAGRSK